jgi:dipeptidyl-peptidase-3
MIHQPWFRCVTDDDICIGFLAADFLPQLSIKPHFEALSQQEKKYAHYISRASFSGTRVNLRQCSPESEAIYDFILALHKSSNGRTLQILARRFRSVDNNFR